jgi:hypothetical protein
VTRLVIVLGTLLMVAPVAARAAADGAPTQSEIEEALTCQCGCGLTVHSCNHLQCPSGEPIKDDIRRRLGLGESRETILAATTRGNSGTSTWGGTGARAMWACKSPSGSSIVNGKTPVSSSYNVTPSEYRSARWSMARLIRPVCSGAMYASEPSIICVVARR